MNREDVSRRFRIIEGRRSRRGMTLIEVLATISIIAILLAILLPAVQMAREASRRIQCANNLRQIGIALNAYLGDCGSYPMCHNGNGYSPQVVLLPYIELKPLFDALNMSATMRGYSPEIATFLNYPVSTYMCPSDPIRPSHAGCTSYAGNRGVGYDESGGLNNGLFNPPFGSEPVSPNSIQDGLSNTAAFSEWLIGPVNFRAAMSTVVSNRSIFQAGAYPQRSQFGMFMAECNSSMVQPVFLVGKGQEWMYGEIRSSLYNHNNAPNRHTCKNDSGMQQSTWTAGSRHSSGVNVLMADGSVGFRKDRIMQDVWRALGTRDGGDIAAD